MASVAEVELARGRAFHAADARPVGPPRLWRGIRARCGWGCIHLCRSCTCLIPAPASGRRTSPGQNLRGAPVTGAEIALVLRNQGFAVPVAVIDAGDARLIEALAQGRTLLAAAEGRRARRTGA